MLRTESSLRDAPVFRSAFFPKRAHCALFSKTLDLQPLRGLLAAHEPTFGAPVFAGLIGSAKRSGFSRSAASLLRTNPPSVRRCSAGLIGSAKRSGFSRSAASGGRGELRSPLAAHQPTFGVPGVSPGLLAPPNAPASAAPRPPGGGGSFAPPCAPLSCPRRSAGLSCKKANRFPTDRRTGSTLPIISVQIPSMQKKESFRSPFCISLFRHSTGNFLRHGVGCGVRRIPGNRRHTSTPLTHQGNIAVPLLPGRQWFRTGSGRSPHRRDPPRQSPCRSGTSPAGPHPGENPPRA